MRNSIKNLDLNTVLTIVCVFVILNLVFLCSNLRKGLKNAERIL
jgi:hypothetical protein